MRALGEPCWTFRASRITIVIQQARATVFFRLVSSKAGKFGFSAVVALFAVLGGFYYAAYRYPHGTSDAVRVEASRAASPRAIQQRRTKSEAQISETEMRAEARVQTKFEVLEAEREMQVASARHKLCLSMAQKNYETTWAASCKTISEQDRKRHERCIAQVSTQAVCAPLARAPSETCALPVELASRPNKELEEWKGRCGPKAAAASQQ
jgi:hypothetical protein